MKQAVIAFSVIAISLFAQAQNVQIGSNVYMAACPTSNAYFTNISLVNSALLADADTRTFVVASNPDRAIAQYKLANASVNVSSKRISYVFSAWYKNAKGIQCQSLLSFEASNCTYGGKDLFTGVRVYGQCMSEDRD